MAAPIKKVVSTPKNVYFSQQMSNVQPVAVTSHPAPPSEAVLSQEQQQPVQDAAGN